MPVGVGTLRMRIDIIVITKGNVYDPPLVCTHGRKLNLIALPHGTRGSGVRHLGHLIMATAFISLNINGNRVSEPKLSTHEQGEHSLKRLERTTMTTDENSKIRSSHIEDKLAIVTLVLIDRRVLSIKESEDRAKNRNRDISDSVKLLVRHLGTLFKVLSELRIITGIGGGLLSGLFDDFF